MDITQGLSPPPPPPPPTKQDSLPTTLEFLRKKYGSAANPIVAKRQAEQVKEWEAQRKAHRTSRVGRSRVAGKEQLAGIMQAYDGSMIKRSSSKSREQLPARVSLDGDNGPPSESIELPTRKAFSTSSNSKQPSIPPSQDTVAEPVKISRPTGLRRSSRSKKHSVPPSRDKVAEPVKISTQKAIPTSSKNECTSHEAAASVSEFELFDNQEPSGDA